MKDGALRKAVVVKRAYAHKEFEEDYNSYRGNAYGLANTLLQTAKLKPSLKPGVLPNLYFAGQLTSPGPGVPPSIISGQVVAKLIDYEHGVEAIHRIEHSGVLWGWFYIFVLWLACVLATGWLQETALYMAVMNWVVAY